MAESTAPAKPASPSRTELARQADAVFWQTLHGGRYDDTGKALEIQTAAYLENPGDATTAAHAGWLHIWRLAESSRLPQVPATITVDAVMARKYFEEAVRLQPGDARFQGFLGSATLAEASIHKDEKLTRRGYYILLDSVAAWPEFNLFTAGYSLSRLPADSRSALSDGAATRPAAQRFDGLGTCHRQRLGACQFRLHIAAAGGCPSACAS
jgi:hypothetical protein